MEETAAAVPVRIFVGGLGESVTIDDLHKIFSSLGQIETVDIIRTKGRSFAYVNFFPSSPNSLSRLFSIYNGCVWKGGRLRIEKAKEDYLACLKREWAEDAQRAIKASTIDIALDDKRMETSDKPKKEFGLENKKLNIFFPRLRKMKSIPFSGSGKHKYSFRRIEVPSLPTYFCDCEEHSGTHPKEEQEILIQEDLHGGMNKEELDLMNSVMNKLFERENASNTMCSEVEPAKEGNHPVIASNGLHLHENEEDSTAEDDLQLPENEEDSNAEDDNLIINVSSQGQDTVLDDQVSILNKMQASKERSTDLKKQRRNIASPKKKRKSVDEEKVMKEPVAVIPRAKGRLEGPSTRSNQPLGAQKIEPEEGVKQSMTLERSKKQSWRELVGNRDNAEFSISDILSGISSTKKEQPKSDNRPNPIDNEDVKFLRYENREQLDKTKVVDGIAEGLPTKSDSVSNRQHDNDKKLLVLENQKDQLDKTQVLEGIAQPPKHDSSPNTGRDNHDEKLMRNENQKAQLEKTELVEGIAGDQSTKPDSASNTGRGSAWLQKSSWTQLVGGSKGCSFSLNQIVPSISFQQEEPAKPDSTMAAKFTDLRHVNLSLSDDVDLMVEKEGGAQKTPETSQQIVVESNEASASNKILEKNNSAKMQTNAMNVVVGETCPFMRTPASLKEWANTKAALSGSRKRKK